MVASSSMAVTSKIFYAHHVGFEVPDSASFSIGFQCWVTFFKALCSISNGFVP
jgi:hypothetical protein